MFSRHGQNVAKFFALIEQKWPLFQFWWRQSCLSLHGHRLCRLQNFSQNWSKCLPIKLPGTSLPHISELFHIPLLIHFQRPMDHVVRPITATARLLGARFLYYSLFRLPWQNAWQKQHKGRKICLDSEHQGILVSRGMTVWLLAMVTGACDLTWWPEQGVENSD